MIGSGSILQDVWREACRQTEIAEAVALLSPILARRLPLGTVLVRRINIARAVVETVAAAGLAAPGTPARARSECTPQELDHLLAWVRQGVVLAGGTHKIEAAVPHVIPAGVGGDALVGPLTSGDDPLGVLVLLPQPPANFDDEHQALVRELLEPFSVALENDARLRELTTLREAAEADRRSLLTRLGRQEIVDTIVGADSGLRHVMERVSLVAASDAPVLIFGETGSGKEVVARAIHTRSRRVAGPFLRVNCGAIAPDLIDSELFGHERGSFTGAVAMRKGWFERADNGTLFLDEVGELPPAAQVRLLRILQDGALERVGGQRQLNVDVRIVAATHRNLQAMAADGRFRQDLWYRLAVFPIHLPALREHVEDIPELATHFALKASRRFGTPPLAPTPQDVNLLVSYSWPGNIRELQSVIERAVILGDGRALEVAKALGATMPAASPAAPAGAAGPTGRIDSGPFLKLGAAMARHIEAALLRARGRIEGRGGAAELLGINPHTLRARMRKLGVDWKRFREDTHP
ncbi:MAG: sigma 54-interacting transcriptional regulator [Planctomycetes bacterium]|nr:sigma 54-interacting transcriptional regulator [Planctomycetota bacterium]